MTRKFKTVEKPAKKHRCVHPGWLSRTLRGFRVGAVIKCRCGNYRKLACNYHRLYWFTLNSYEIQKYLDKLEK